MSATAERPPRPLETAPPAPVRRPTVGPPRPVRTPAAMAAARRRALASSNIATAARRFGDEYPPARRQWHIRAAGVVLMALMVFYLGWLFAHLAPQHPWLAWPFAAASVLSGLCLLLSVINGWTTHIPEPHPLTGDAAPDVAVLIPTLGEPIPMILRTVLSVIEQDYPEDRVVVIVSDDAHSPELARALDGLGVIYHEPPPRFAPGRDGAAKAGNLNSALAFVQRRFPEVKYIETRDADDEVGAKEFLRHAVGQLEHDARVAFVQTVKEAQVSAGDPFLNFDAQFYRSQMFARHAANAVFPCGSGLVWRRAALEQIGGFPTWNLVEDFQSGVEALRRGWRGCYLPLVGAVGQHSPEDVANVIKQRGTWAIDTVRLMVWGNLRGLNLRQRLGFSETLLFYLHSFTVLVYVPCTALACVSILPVDASPLSCLIHLMPYALMAELRLFFLNQPFADRRGRQRRPLRALWRVKVMWLGLAPTYIIACCKAIFGGRDRKPLYKVTRKTNHFRWYWKETLPQGVLAILPLVGLLVGVTTGRLPSALIMLSAGYWGAINSAALANFFARGWYGKASLGHLRGVDRRRLPEASATDGDRAQAAAPVHLAPIRAS